MLILVINASFFGVSCCQLHVQRWVKWALQIFNFLAPLHLLSCADEETKVSFDSLQLEIADEEYDEDISAVDVGYKHPACERGYQ